jgi:hypothetical protein
MSSSLKGSDPTKARQCPSPCRSVAVSLLVSKPSAAAVPGIISRLSSGEMATDYLQRVATTCPSRCAPTPTSPSPPHRSNRGCRIRPGQPCFGTQSQRPAPQTTTGVMAETTVCATKQRRTALLTSVVRAAGDLGGTGSWRAFQASIDCADYVHHSGSDLGIGEVGL